MRKRHVRFCFPIFLLVILMGFASSAALPGELSNKSIVGFWFGVHHHGRTNGETQEICHFKADGTFYIRFRKVKDGQPVREQNESGRWELKDNVKTMVTTHIGNQGDVVKLFK
jgi:hypothetical protein